MNYKASKDIPWGPSMLMGVQFVFKDKRVVVPDLPPKFTSVQNSTNKYELNFDYERKILKDYEATEERERRRLKKNTQAEGTAKADLAEMKESSIPVVPHLTPIEPEKSVTSSTESTRKAPVKVDSSILEDFEFRALRDDPFIAAELGTINDLEELRDVLASMQTTEPVESKKTNMYKILKNISFPHLSLDESIPNQNVNKSSAPSSQPNLFGTSHQPILTCDTSERASYSNNIANENDMISRPSHSRNANASPIKFELESDTTKSENERQTRSIDSDCGSLSSVSLQKEPFYRSTPSFQSVTHIPIPMGNEIQNQNRSRHVSESFLIESPIEEECQPDDPPVVQRVVKMGFKRRKALALYKVVTKHEVSVSENSMISQLCNWNELEDKGLEPTVCFASVVFAPNDLEKAFKFGTMVSELCEMGFPIDSVLTAVRTSNMSKEEAVMHLLDPNANSSNATPPRQHSSHHHYPHLLESLSTQGISRKSKKKEKKSYLSYLHAKH
ncbi:unnamed protein product [Rodentolepis nana]|uniref:UBA domain-containing protein n=1 Tax=Rodentolepis nana TaxID=102285 RepID=A0A0R3TK06_RODNA|nr:unnamed protein product [Rodentolepis nana]